MQNSPATIQEMTTALGPLFRSLRPPMGMKNDDLVDVYTSALMGLPLWAVEEAVSKYLRGAVPKQSDEFCPRPPGLFRVATQMVEREAAKIARVEASLKPPPMPLKRSAFLELWDQGGGTLAGFSKLMAKRPDYGQPLKRPKPPVAPPAERRVPDYSKDKIEATPVMRKRLVDMGLVSEDELIGTEFLSTREGD
jgi:hypothetical protein